MNGKVNSSQNGEASPRVVVGFRLCDQARGIRSINTSALWGPILKTKYNPRSMSALLSMGHQAAHSSNRRIISMSLHPIRMTEPHNMKGTP